MLSYMSCLYTLDINALLVIVFANILSYQQVVFFWFVYSYLSLLMRRALIFDCLIHLLAIYSQ